MKRFHRMRQAAHRIAPIPGFWAMAVTLLLLLLPRWTLAVELSPQDQKVLTRIERYLNGIHTVRSGFVQVNVQNGNVAQGKLYVKRPGKMRVEYDPPYNWLMVASGVMFTFYDGKDDEPTYMPQSATPLKLLLKDDINLRRDATIQSIERSAGLIRLTVSDKDDPQAAKGSLTLTFNADPVRLEQWVVRDAQGNRTKLALLDPEYGVKIPDERFRFINPSPPNDKQLAH